MHRESEILLTEEEVPTLDLQVDHFPIKGHTLFIKRHHFRLKINLLQKSWLMNVECLFAHTLIKKEKKLRNRFHKSKLLAMYFSGIPILFFLRLLLLTCFVKNTF